MNEIKCPNCETVFEIDEASFAAILKQVRGEEFERELHERLKLETDLAKAQAEKDLTSKLSEKEKEIEQLKAKVENTKVATELEFNKELEKIKQERDQIASKLELQEKQKEVDALKIKEKYELDLRDKADEIERLKLSRSQRSSYLIGASLEEHCQKEFDAIRMTAFPRATFEKDTDDKSGSKGDFIFREYDENGVELISIMFEMKNEADDSVKKTKNESHFAKLGKDRNTKHCEFAVLVSTLEKNDPFYDRGIVDVSYKYPKMFVIRPEFFIPIISFLRNAALGQMIYRQKLAEAEAKNIDIRNFEQGLENFKVNFLKAFDKSAEHYEAAIVGVQKSIDELEKVKAFLEKFYKSMKKANRTAQDMTTKELTKDSPTLIQSLKEIEGNNKGEN
jgi:hypothetical protein